MPEVRLQLNGDKLKPIGLSSATGWVATLAVREVIPLVAWALLEDGQVIGLVEHGGIFVSAEHMLNFTGFRTSAIRPI